jgi:twitching motility protein PilT
MDILSLFYIAKAQGASDIHLLVSSPPILRINGTLGPMQDLEPLTPEDVEQALKQITTETEREKFRRDQELDFGYTAAEIGRVRCNAALQQGTVALAIRMLPRIIPSIEALRLPKICQDLALRPRGMIVVTGPTGSGKSTTLASMISYMNRTVNRRVVTIEDPIEYQYENDRCTVTQREIGGDTSSFAEALKHVIRQDPDVILVGEMRDFETAAAALSVAETGHLVMTTGHAPSAYQAVERIIDLFPPHERHLAQSRLASLLTGVLCQTLVPKLDEAGRVPAVEVMLANPAMRNLIRESKIHQLPNLIRTSSNQGMQLLDEALLDLFRQRAISRENVFAYCNERDQLERLMGTERMAYRGRPVATAS